MSISFRLRHQTRYRYEGDVAASYSRLHLTPRDTPFQACRSSTITVSPQPDDYAEQTDYFGNHTAYCEVQTAHRELGIVSECVVDVTGPQPTLDQSSGQYALDSPFVARGEEFFAYAERSRGRDVASRVLDLSTRIHREFEYLPGSTSIATPVHEVLARRQGVCQDFAHLAIACLRSTGIAARYVSGYVETDHVGGDQSHAWVSAYVPGVGWLDLDPTNDQLVDDRYVTVAWGRDYEDVAPIMGVIYSAAPAASMDVQVSLTRVP